MGRSVCSSLPGRSDIHVCFIIHLTVVHIDVFVICTFHNKFLKLSINNLLTCLTESKYSRSFSLDLLANGINLHRSQNNFSPQNRFFLEVLGWLSQ